MIRRSPFVRLLVWVLILHCAHMPFPSSDGAEQAAGERRVEKGALDIDFILLGTDLPNEVDEGPIDDDPEHRPTPFGDCFLIAEADPSDSDSDRLRPSGTCIPQICSARVALAGSNTQTPESRSLRSFGASFTISTPQAWRKLLSVFLI